MLENTLNVQDEILDCPVCRLAMDGRCQCPPCKECDELPIDCGCFDGAPYRPGEIVIVSGDAFRHGLRLAVAITYADARGFRGWVASSGEHYGLSINPLAWGAVEERVGFVAPNLGAALKASGRAGFVDADEVPQWNDETPAVLNPANRTLPETGGEPLPAGTRVKIRAEGGARARRGQLTPLVGFVADSSPVTVGEYHRYQVAIEPADWNRRGFRPTDRLEIVHAYSDEIEMLEPAPETREEVNALFERLQADAAGS